MLAVILMRMHSPSACLKLQVCSAFASPIVIRCMLAGLNPVVAQSYAKNLGVYGERVGAVNVVCDSTDEKNAVLSQLGYSIARPMYSSCPLHGSRIAAMVLTDPHLRSEWMKELQIMSGRIKHIRAALTTELLAIDTPGDW